MGTYQEYMNAARNAHAAGNAEHARQLVQAAQRAQKGNSPTLVATTKDGEVLRMPDGTMAFKSPGYSTTDPATIERIMEG